MGGVTRRSEGSAGEIYHSIKAIRSSHDSLVMLEELYEVDVVILYNGLIARSGSSFTFSTPSEMKFISR